MKTALADLFSKSRSKVHSVNYAVGTGPARGRHRRWQVDELLYLQNISTEVTEQAPLQTDSAESHVNGDARRKPVLSLSLTLPGS